MLDPFNRVNRVNRAKMLFNCIIQIESSDHPEGPKVDRPKGE